MWSVNNLPTNVLISADEVASMISSNSFSPQKINASIQIAEEQFVKQILGYNFYQYIIAEKNVLVTSGNIATLQTYFTAAYGDQRPPIQVGQIVNAIELPTVSPATSLLWKTVLWKFVYECVYFVMLPDNYAQFTASGIEKNNPSPAFLGGTSSGTSSGIGLRDLKYLRDNGLLGRINIMQDALEQFLCVNSASYPLFPNPDKWGHDGKKKSRKGSFIDIYECDDDDRRYDNRRSAPMPTPVPTPRTLSCTLVLNIVETPNPDALYPLCNLQTIPLEYPAGNTLTIPHLIGLTVNPNILIGLTPVYCPTNPATGVLDNSGNGGFPLGAQVIINYNEIV